MSSSGKGQSVVKDASELEAAFTYAMEGSRGDLKEIIVEGFIDFHTEITLLTVTQKEGETLFCAPLATVKNVAIIKKAGSRVLWINHSLRKLRIWREKLLRPSVERAFGVLNSFWAHDAVYFSELSPRPHDTGMVTLAGTQNFNEFELHVRTLGLEYSSHRT